MLNVIMMNVIMLSVTILNVIMLNVIMLSVVAPSKPLGESEKQLRNEKKNGFKGNRCCEVVKASNRLSSTFSLAWLGLADTKKK
jgi:hypothetical protein